ncbi:MAG: dihydrolipoyl dehydrogenase [Clostridia bacterium]|nr:dihydrolipoyl dehydrogenase [Clostridia bacterium]
MKYDLIVIGGGPAGYNCAERATHAGLNVAVIEQAKLGGVCLNSGCIPSKALLQSAKVADYVRHADMYGVQATYNGVNHKFILDRKNRIVRKLVAGIKLQLKSANVTVIEGKAIIKDKQDNLYTISVNDQTYTCTYLIIATGSTAIIPPIKGVTEGVNEGRVLDNVGILDLADIPANLVVIGGGVIGLEMASYYTSMGSQVTVVEALSKIAGNTDSQVTAILQTNYEKKGVRFLTNTMAVAIDNEGVTVKSGDQLTRLPADKVLLSVGRKANAIDGIDRLGIATNRGFIVTDEHLRTNIDNVYAIGDCNGKVMLAHTAYREGEVAVNTIMGIDDYINYDAIPSVIYTNPEIASIGKTAEQATNDGLTIVEQTLPMQYSGRYVAENTTTDGICKLVLHNDRLIGATIIGNGASEFIVLLSAMIGLDINIEQLKTVVFPHPTVSEIIRESIFSLE